MKIKSTLCGVKLMGGIVCVPGLAYSFFLFIQTQTLASL